MRKDNSEKGEPETSNILKKDTSGQGNLINDNSEKETVEKENICEGIIWKRITPKRTV